MCWLNCLLLILAAVWCNLGRGPATNPTGDRRAVTALRIANIESSSDCPPTLQDVFAHHIKPELELRGESTTAKNYQTAISKFTAFLALGTTTDSSRATPLISDLHVLAWQKWELENGLAPSTINTHWKFLRSVFRRMGKREKGNPRGLGILETVPHVTPLPTKRPNVKVVSLDALDAIYTYGCPDMPWPPAPAGVTTADIWRCWIVCAYNLAMRTRDLLRMKRDWLHFDAPSLNPDSDVESPHGWISWTPAKTKNKKPEPLVLPLHRTVRSHLETMLQHDEPYVFGRAFATCSNRKLYGQSERPGEWYRLLDLTSTYKSVPRFVIKAIRATANSQYNHLDRKLGSQILGHAPRGVNDMFYQQWEADLVAYVGRLPQPPSFLSEPHETLRQTLLF